MLWANFRILAGRRVVRPFNSDGALIPYWQLSHAPLNCSCANCSALGGFKWNGPSITGIAS